MANRKKSNKRLPDFGGQGYVEYFSSTTFDNISEIFDKYSFGVTTHRDHFVVGFTQEEIKQKMRTFVSNLTDDLVALALDLKETTDFKINTARLSIKKMDWKEYIRPYSYRPFDDRHICYLKDLIDRDRSEIMQHIMDKDNLALSLTRRLRDHAWQHIYATQYITDKTLLSSRDNCYFFPLYLYQEKSKSRKRSLGSAMMLFEPEADYGAKKPNLSADVVDRLAKAYRKTPSPEEIFYYIYGVLYSETYRTKYAEFLKIDFPRVPFTKNYKLFKQISKYGNRLVDLHLLRSPELDSPIAKFQGKGDYRVERLKYDEKTGRVYINATQYFGDIAQTAPLEI